MILNNVFAKHRSFLALLSLACLGLAGCAKDAYPTSNLTIVNTVINSSTTPVVVCDGGLRTKVVYPNIAHTAIDATAPANIELLRAISNYDGAGNQLLREGVLMQVEAWCYGAGGAGGTDGVGRSSKSSGNDDQEIGYIKQTFKAAEDLYYVRLRYSIQVYAPTKEDAERFSCEPISWTLEETLARRGKDICIFFQFY